MLVSGCTEMTRLDNRVPLLKQTIRFREQPHGGILINDAEGSFGKFLLVSPFEAFIFSLFDGTRTIQDLTKMLKALKNSPNEELIQRDIHSFVQQHNEFVELIAAPLAESRINIDPLKFLSKPNMFSRPIRADKPLWVDFYVTRECNLKCVYCFANAKYIRENNSSKPFQLDRARILNLVDQIADLGIKRVLVTGGEPALVSYLLDIIGRLSNLGIDVVLATNACLMTDKLAQGLIEAGVTKVQAKLDAACPGIQDKLSGVDGSFTKLIEGIRILKKHPLKVSVASVVTALNIREIPHVIRICANLGVDEVSPRIHMPGIWALRGRGGLGLNPPRSTILWLEQEILELQDKYDNIMEVSQIDSSQFSRKKKKKVSRCPGFISSCTILENGLVVPCETLADFSHDFVIGDANKKTLVDIWNSENAESWVLRRYPRIEGPCSTCDEFARCKGGCPWKSYVAYGKWMVDPTCIEAPPSNLIPVPKT